jgi:hypothetical protein
MTALPPEQSENNWRRSAYMTGGLLGLLAGLISAHLYTRNIETAGQKQPGQISNASLIQIMIAAITLMRQISELGGPKPPAKGRS